MMYELQALILDQIIQNEHILLLCLTLYLENSRS